MSNQAPSDSASKMAIQEPLLIAVVDDGLDRRHTQERDCLGPQYRMSEGKLDLQSERALSDLT